MTANYMKSNQVQTHDEKPSLLDAITDAHGWVQTWLGQYRAMLFNSEKNQVFYTYVEKDFDEIRTGFSDVLDELLRASHQGHRYLRDTLLLWEQDWPIAKRPGVTDQYVKEIASIRSEDVDLDAKTVILLAETYQAAETKSGVPYCLSHDTTYVTVHWAWLEENFPGSVERLHIGLGLGITAHELAKFTITAPVSPATDAELPANLIEPD